MLNRFGNIFICVLLFNSSCKEDNIYITEQKINKYTGFTLEFYAVPRNDNFCLFNNNVYLNSLEKKNRKVSFEDRTYQSDIKGDSINIYVFDSCSILTSEYTNLLKSIKLCKRPLKIAPKMLLIFNHTTLNFRDTFEINSVLQVQNKNRVYEMSEELWQIIESRLPKDLLNSWKKNLPKR